MLENTSTFKFYVDRHGNHQNSQYITDAGELHYDPNSAEVRMGDGVTPGGIQLGGGANLDLTQLYTNLEIDNKISNIIGTANNSGNTLGKLQTLINNNTTSITNIQNAANNLPPDKDMQTLAFDGVNTLTISNGNVLPIQLSVNPAEYLYMEFANTYYYAQSSASWMGASSQLPRNPVNVVNPSGIYGNFAWGKIRLDSNRLYKIIFDTDYVNVRNSGLNGATWPVVNGYTAINIYMGFSVATSSTNRNLIAFSYLKGDNRYSSFFGSGGAYGTATRRLEQVIKIKGSYLDQGTPYHYIIPELYGDPSFNWAGKLIIMTLD